MMFYYTFKNGDNVKSICETLNKCGFTCSHFTCAYEYAKGIATVGHCCDNDYSIIECKQYVLLDEGMMSKDPRIGWIEPYRYEVKNLDEFFDKCNNLA